MIKNSISSPLPFLKFEGGAESSKLLIKIWSFWPPTPIPKLSRDPTRVTSSAQKVVLSLVKFQGIKKLCQDRGSKTNYCNKDVPFIPFTQKITRVLRALCLELRMKATYIFIIISQYHTRTPRFSLHPCCPFTPLSRLLARSDLFYFIPG